MARISKAQQAEIRQYILQVASTKFQELGYDGVSTKQIAKEVGIAEGTLFNYFDSKTHLFLEVFAEEFVRYNDEFRSDLDLTGSVVDILYNQLYQLAKKIITLPKRILSELMTASIKMYRKHPKTFMKFAELDFKYMENTKLLLDDMKAKGLLVDADTTFLSEMIYSILMYEFLIYLYDKDIEKETMLQNIKTKLELLLQGYIIGGSTHGN